jgi:hypothetical protein
MMDFGDRDALIEDDPGAHRFVSAKPVGSPSELHAVGLFGRPELIEFHLRSRPTVAGLGAADRIMRANGRASRLAAMARGLGHLGHGRVR